MGRPATADVMKATARIETRRLDLLTTDPEVQRPLDDVRVNKIAKGFRWEAFGVPVVSRRPDGKEVVLDGQHRIAAARTAGFSSTGCRVLVYTGLSREQEAEMFRLLNDTKHPTALDLFLVALIERRPEEMEINSIIEDHGLKVVRSGDRAFKAVAAARAVYNLGPDTLRRTLHILTSAWGVNALAVDSRLVHGVGRVAFRYNGAIDARRMTVNLAKYAGGAAGVIGAARQLHSIRSVPVTEAVADIVVRAYNKSKTTGALPEWGEPIDARE
jgi:hypothetical protein